MPWSGGAKLVENGPHVTIAEIAAAEKINESYVGRLLRLTLLAPDLVEAILGGRQPAEVTLAGLMRPFAVAWTEQQAKICPKLSGQLVKLKGLHGAHR
jgi:hypothetical protein